MFCACLETYNSTQEKPIDIAMKEGNLEIVLYISVSQPFGLQVPVEDKFLHYSPGHNFLFSFCPSMCF